MRLFRLIGLLFFLVFPTTAIQAELPLAESEIIIRFSDNTDLNSMLQPSERTPSSWRNIVTGLQTQKIEPLSRSNNRQSPLTKTVLISFYDPNELAAAKESIERLPYVRYVQPNYLRSFCQDPNDPLFSDQWALAKINAVQAWQIESGISQIILAIIDSGLDYNHPDLAGNIWQNPAEIPGNGLDDDQNGYIDDRIGWDFSDAPDLPGVGDYYDRDNDPMDESSHGSHVAGIAAAVRNNGQGISGVAPNCRIMAVRAGFRLQFGGGFLQDDDVAAAIVYAVDNGANVINMSFGDPRFSPLLQDAARYAAEHGCVLVAAAGNQGGPEIFYPAAYDEVIAVGATDDRDQLASTSSFGSNLDLVAPGVSIISTNCDQAYQNMSGTSMAAPHISGAVGLLLAHDPTLTATEIRTILRQSAHDLGQSGFDPFFGAGRLDLQAALATLSEMAVQIDYPWTGLGINGQVPLIGTAAGEGFDYFRLEYGYGPAPSEWIVIQTSSQPVNGPDTLALFETGSLAEGQVSIQLIVRQDGGAEFSDQVLVSIDHSLPVVSRLAVAERLAGDQFHYFITWETDDMTYGQVLFKPGDEEEATVLASSFLDMTHAVEITDHLRSGCPDYEFSLKVKNSADIEIIYNNAGQPFYLSDFSEGLDLTSVSNYGFNLAATIPNGRFLDKYTDFDHDGHQEIAVMVYGSSVYEPVTFFEIDTAGGFEPVFSTSQSFLPWDAGDVDGDGKIDLLAGGVRTAFLVEGDSPDSFPARIIWQQDDVWGNTIADTDRDGQLEIVSRYDPQGTQNEGIIIFEAIGDDTFSQGLILPNPSEGLNNIGSTMAIADFDGDQKTEILGSDIDGDLFIYETTTDNNYSQTWTHRLPEETTPIVSTPADLDGDNLIEFIVLTAIDNEIDPENSYWVVRLFKATGNDQFETTWQIAIAGVVAGEAGAAVTDFDNDGRPDLIIQTTPDLYIFKNEGQLNFDPVYHANQNDSGRPIIADADENGRLEVVINRMDHIAILEQLAVSGNPYVPTGLSARALNESTVRLQWDEHPLVHEFNIYRAPGQEPLVIYQAQQETTRFTDTAAGGNLTYRYAVSSINSGGLESPLSAEVTVQPTTAPQIMDVSFADRHRLTISFDQAIDPQPILLTDFVVEDSIYARSYVVDRSKTRLLVSFEAPFQPRQSYSFRISNLQNEGGTLLFPNPTIRSISYEDITAPILTRVDVRSTTQLDLVFSEVLEDNGATNPDYYLFQPNLEIAEISLDSTIVQIDLADEITPGADYLVEVRQITDLFGNEISPGNGNLARFALPLPDNIFCYPNPVSGQTVTFANLPRQASIRIFTPYGDLVKKIEKESGATELTIALIDDDGESLASGVFIYVVKYNNGLKKGKIAVVR